MRHCECLKPRINRKYQHVLTVHPDDQDRQSPAWLALLQLIEQAVADGREVFDPGRELGSELWQQISVLPTQIGQLKQVKHLQLYGSQLTRIPAQIGEMTALEEFTPYGSYRLHWFPYEITRCKNLISSTISTRSLYGNKRHRTAFPKLRGNPIDFVEPVFLQCLRRTVAGTRPQSSMDFHAGRHRCSAPVGPHLLQRVHRKNPQWRPQLPAPPAQRRTGGQKAQSRFGPKLLTGSSHRRIK